MHVGVGVVQNVQGKPRPGLPGECLDDAPTLNAYRGVATQEPTDRILQQVSEVRVSGPPHGPLDITREIYQAALTLFADNHRRFIRLRLRRIGEFRWIGYESRHYRER